MWKAKKENVNEARVWQQRIRRQRHTSVEILKQVYGRRGMNADALAFEASKNFRHVEPASNTQQGNELSPTTDTVPLTYGEIEFSSFQSILDIVLQDPTWARSTFVDLGCGTGKPVLVAALGDYGFTECIGIELIGELVEIGQRVCSSVQVMLSNHNQGIILHQKDGKRGSTNSHKKKKGTTKKKNAPKALTVDEFRDQIEVALSSSNNFDRGMPLDKLSDCLVLTLGRRTYKESLKGQGSLKKFLLKHMGDTVCMTKCSGDSNQSENGHNSQCEICSNIMNVAEENTTEQRNVDDMTMPTDRRRGQCDETNREVENGQQVQCLGAPASDLSSTRQKKGKGRQEEHSSISAGSFLIRMKNLKVVGKSFKQTRSGEGTTHEEPEDQETITSNSACSTEGAPSPAVQETSTNQTAEKTAAVNYLNSDNLEADNFPAQNEENGLNTEPAVILPIHYQYRDEFFHVPKIDLIQGDIFEVDWSHADVIYVASLLFSDAMMEQLAVKVTNLKKGSRIISLKMICSDELKPLHEGFFRMSWQMAYVYILIKI